MINELQLLAGVDVPFPEAQLVIHPPTLKELAYLGEDRFFLGYQLLTFSKDILSSQDKKRLSDIDDFDILMQIVLAQGKPSALQDSVDAMFLLLTLLFPNYTTQIVDRQFLLSNNDDKHYISRKNFQAFRAILTQLFPLFNDVDAEKSNFKPAGALAQRIADKLKKRHQQLAEQKGDGNKIAICSRYVSILAVGEHKDINALMQYTIYQLLDEYKRFGLKEQYDTYIRAKLAGAQDLKEPEDWMKDMYSKDKKGLSQQDLVIK